MVFKKEDVALFSKGSLASLIKVCYFEVGTKNIGLFSPLKSQVPIMRRVSKNALLYFDISRIYFFATKTAANVTG